MTLKSISGKYVCGKGSRQDRFSNTHPLRVCMCVCVCARARASKGPRGQNSLNA